VDVEDLVLSIFTLISSSNTSLSSLIVSVLLNIHRNLQLVIKLPMSCSAHTSLRPSFKVELNDVCCAYARFSLPGVSTALAEDNAFLG
jgi:hypothetical protein